MIAVQILEFGNKNKEKIILIHGFITPYQIWNDYINYYKDSYHLIVPILQGHNPNVEEDFISFKKAAAKLEDYYISRYGNRVYAIVGLSMGGIFASQIWQNKKISIEKLIFESSPLLPYNRFMTFILNKLYLMFTHRMQKRDIKLIKLSKNRIISERILNDFLVMIDKIPDITIKKYIYAMGQYKLPNNINSTNTKLYYFYGSQLNEILSKKTAIYLRKYYPNSYIKCFYGKGHCQYTFIESKKLIKILDKVLIKK